MIHEIMIVIIIQYVIEIMGFNLIQDKGKHLAPINDQIVYHAVE